MPLSVKKQRLQRLCGYFHPQTAFFAKLGLAQKNCIGELSRRLYPPNRDSIRRLGVSLAKKIPLLAKRSGILGKNKYNPPNFMRLSI